MPGGDRTGPLGQGPLTGRRMGYCVGEDRPGDMYNSGYGYGRGWGRELVLGRGFRRGFGPGRGMGYGNFYQENITDVSEKTLLENEIRILKEQLSSLENRLSKRKEEI
ncbi:DUF5320 domain-containing protein [Bacteroidota bacterium]